MTSSSKVDELRLIMDSVANVLGISNNIYNPINPSGSLFEKLSEVDSRESTLRCLINEYNDFVVQNDPETTKTFRLFVVSELPRFLVGYQLLRFPSVSSSEDWPLPTKQSLQDFPEAVVETGLYVPVSACLRLLAVCLSDVEAKQCFIDSGNVKALMSHMVDDPLNPLQRESAIFAVNVLTRDFEPAQRSIAELMSSRPS
jgi:hypothetical protein